MNEDKIIEAANKAFPVKMVNGKDVNAGKREVMIEILKAICEAA